jgi:hypothetical protein
LYKEKTVNIRLLVALLVVGFSPLSGAYLYKNGHLINQKDVATSSVEQHYQRGIEALKAKKWEEAYQQFHIVVVNFADTSLAQEAQYYLGVTLYEMNDLEEQRPHSHRRRLPVQAFHRPKDRRRRSLPPLWMALYAQTPNRTIDCP